VAVVFAHPDDETIGCGALLSRLPRAQIVMVTNGCPENPSTAWRKGFADRRSYAAARANELRFALAIAGIGESSLHSLDVDDGNVWREWTPIVSGLAQFFERQEIATVLTHAFEGGHSDHDGVALCVHMAARLVRNQPTIIEMPYYHIAPSGLVYQAFSEGETEIVCRLTAEQARMKRAMFRLYATQRTVLGRFDPEIERFRIAGRSRTGTRAAG
jgi:LmbE family N-acetylglucosaminyl deacetylase